ncbi:MAG: hypothetical protein AABW64_00250 [Nanoarchaeota archaeon]
MKRGQLSYEYILVIGMVLVLIIPFFYIYAKGLTGDLSARANQDLMTRVAQAVETVVNLGGSTTTLRVTGEIKSITAASAQQGGSSAQTGTLSVTASNGATYSATYAGANVYLGTGTLTGSGTVNVAVTKSLRQKSVAISTQGEPVIVAICNGGLSLDAISTATSPQCIDDPNQMLQVTPSDEFYIIGANLQGPSTASGVTIPMIKTSAQQLEVYCSEGCLQATCLPNGYCSTVTVATELIEELPSGQDQFMIQVKTSATGTGDYSFVAKTSAGMSSLWKIAVNPSQGGGQGSDDD